MKTPLLISAILVLLSISMQKAEAQTSESTGKTTWSVETDPATFAFKGYALHLRVKPSFSENWVLGAGIYAMDFPSFMVDLNKKNKNEGWNVRISGALSFFGEYYLKQANNAWFLGFQGGVQNFENTNDHSGSKKSDYSVLLLMPSAGYTWKPFEIPLYFKPWMGIGYTSKLSGSTKIDSRDYDLSPVTAFVTLHIGYTF